MIDEKMARVTSAALMMLTVAHDAGISDDDTFAACEYIIGTRRQIAENNVIHLRGRVEAPSRASRQPSITGTDGSRFAFAPVLSPTTTNTEAPQTGDQPSSTGPQE